MGEIEPRVLFVDELQKRIRLRPGVLVVGRSPEVCDLVLVHQSVSRVHCLLIVGRDRVRVRDLGSRNGVRVNRRRVRKQDEVKAGDLLRIGSLHCRIGDTTTSEPTIAVLPDADDSAPIEPSDSEQPVRDDLFELDDNSADLWADDEPTPPPLPDSNRAAAGATLDMDNDDDRLALMELNLDEELDEGEFLMAADERLDDDDFEEQRPAGPGWLTLPETLEPVRPLILPASIITFLLMVLIVVWSFWPRGPSDAEVHARLVRMLDIAQEPLISGTVEQPTLSPADRQQLDHDIIALRPYANTDHPIKLELFHAATDGLSRSLTVTGEEALYCLQLCEFHLDNARKLMSGKPISSLSAPPRYLPPEGTF